MDTVQAIVQVTFGGMPDITAGQLAEITNALEAPGSGPGGVGSFSDYINQLLADNPAELATGQQYVLWSSNSQGKLAQDYVAASNGGAGTIGDTAYGVAVESIVKGGAGGVMSQLSAELQTVTSSLGLTNDQAFFQGDPAAAVRDLLWNAGSFDFVQNAIASGQPIVGFVDGASAGRAFNHSCELYEETGQLIAVRDRARVRTTNAPSATNDNRRCEARAA